MPIEDCFDTNRRKIGFIVVKHFWHQLKKKILAPINHWNYSQEMSWCLSVTTQRDHVVFLWTPTKVSWAVALTISWSAHFLVRVCAFHLPLPRPAKEKWLLSKLSVSEKTQGNNDSDFNSQFRGCHKTWLRLLLVWEAYYPVVTKNAIHRWY